MAGFEEQLAKQLSLTDKAPPSHTPQTSLTLLFTPNEPSIPLPIAKERELKGQLLQSKGTLINEIEA